MALFDPKLELEAKRRKLLAERLIKAGEQPLDTQVVGGIAVKNSPFAALAKGLSAAGGAWAESKSVDQEKEAAEQRQKLLASAINKMAEGKYNEGASILSADPDMAKEAIGVVKEAMPKEKKLSATEQKEFFEATDAIKYGENAVGNLTQALNIARGGPDGKQPKSFSGAGAETLAMANRVPLIGMFIDDERAAATTEQGNLVKQQALDQLKAIFSGMPTEGERKVLMQLQALPSYSLKEQEAIIANATNLANNRIKQNSAKAKAIDTGDTGALYQTATPSAAGGDWSIEEIK